MNYRNIIVVIVFVLSRHHISLLTEQNVEKNAFYVEFSRAMKVTKKQIQTFGEKSWKMFGSTVSVIV